jgi:hypothetical protein
LSLETTVSAAKSSSYVLCSLLRTQAYLGGGALGPHKGVVHQGYAQCPLYLLGQEGGLIVASFSETLGVERYRDDDVYGKLILR